MVILKGQEPYLGYLDIEMTKEELSSFYEGTLTVPGLVENQYIFIRQSTDQRIVDKYCVYN